MLTNDPTSTPQKSTSQQPASDRKEPLHQYFLNALKEMYWSEQEITEGLKKLQSAATHSKLVQAFKKHETETREHVVRLEKIFEITGEIPEVRKCPAMESILKESDEITALLPNASATLDAILIIAAQKVEHYEIASYGGLVALAETLNLSEAAHILQSTLEEEKETDLLLTELAENRINDEAGNEDEGDDEEQ